MTDLSAAIAGVRFRNPVIAASGTFGYGAEYGRVIDVASLGVWEVRVGAEDAEPPLNCGETRSSAWISEYPDRVIL